MIATGASFIETSRPPIYYCPKILRLRYSSCSPSMDFQIYIFLDVINIFYCHKQISDFGLAKWLPEKWTHHVVFPIEGTFGFVCRFSYLFAIFMHPLDLFGLMEIQTVPDTCLQSTLCMESSTRRLMYLHMEFYYWRS